MNFLKKLFSGVTDRLPATTLLFEEDSPLCPVVATVEQFGDALFFFLQHAEENEKIYPLRGTWLRNLKPAPPRMTSWLFNWETLPLLPAKYCRFPEGQSPLDPDELHLIWDPSGDGAALLEGDEVLAYIPSWSECIGGTGYARDCKSRTLFCRPFPEEEDLLQEIRAAEAYWEAWAEEFHPFYMGQPQILSAYEEHFGAMDTYYAIDQPDGPPLGVYLRQGPQYLILGTVGMSLLAMPKLSVYYKEYKQWEHIELMLMLPVEISEPVQEDLIAELSDMVMLPWEYVTFIKEGRFLVSDVLEDYSFAGFVFSKEVRAYPELDLGNEIVNTTQALWLIPVYEGELILLKQDSRAFLQRLNSLGKQALSLNRPDLSQRSFFSKNKSGYSSKSLLGS